jgi:hypothetical protein
MNLAAYKNCGKSLRPTKAQGKAPKSRAYVVLSLIVGLCGLGGCDRTPDQVAQDEAFVASLWPKPVNDAQPQTRNSALNSAVDDQMWAEGAQVISATAQDLAFGDGGLYAIVTKPHNMPVTVISADQAGAYEDGRAKLDLRTQATPPPRLRQMAQLGAFASESSALAAWALMAHEFPQMNGFSPRLQTIQTPKGVKVRLKTGPFDSQAQALAFCRNLGINDPWCAPKANLS